MADRIRDGKGHRAYRRQALALRRRVQRDGLPCAGCGFPFEWDKGPNHPRAFTADHPQALANGGKLLGQLLEPLCRSCNSRKGDRDTTTTEIWEAS